MTLGHNRIRVIIGIVTFSIKKLTMLPDFPKDRDSGYFTIRRQTDGRILLIAQIGECKEEKSERYFKLSQEKGLRLFQRKNDVSSWQSRDENAQFYGGAIIAKDLILSFSGLPELADEAIMLETAFISGLITNEEAIKIAKISTNDFFNKLSKAPV